MSVRTRPEHLSLVHSFLEAPALLRHLEGSGLECFAHFQTIRITELFLWVCPAPQITGIVLRVDQGTHPAMH